MDIKERFNNIMIIVIFTEKKVDYISFIVDQSSDICYTDVTGQKTCYVNFGNDTWTNGNQFCQNLGGQLPTVNTSGKYTFLGNNFGTYYWIGLEAKAGFVLLYLIIYCISMT